MTIEWMCRHCHTMNRVVLTRGPETHQPCWFCRADKTLYPQELMWP